MIKTPNRIGPHMIMNKFSLQTIESESTNQDRKKDPPRRLKIKRSRERSAGEYGDHFPVPLKVGLKKLKVHSKSPAKTPNF